MTALFFALIGMIYGRTHTRMIHEMGGLMKVVPFLGVAYMIGGFASLGLPGFSGFVAEMTVLFGAFQHADIFHRVVTIVAAIVIIAIAAPPPPGRRRIAGSPDDDHQADDFVHSLTDPAGALAKNGYLADPRRWEDEGLGQPYESARED